MVQDLLLHVDALLSAMQHNQELFAPVSPYVKSLSQALKRLSSEADKQVLVSCAVQIEAFYNDFPDASSSPGFLWIPPAEVANSRRIVQEITASIERLTSLPDDEFRECFRPKRVINTTARRKPHPEHVAQVCQNGHLVLGSINQFPQFEKAFCEDCGTATTDRCEQCRWPIAGIGPNAWMGGSGPYRPPRYCGECGNPFPWTATALAVAREYTDELDELSVEEKTSLKKTVEDLTSDTVRTPMAVNRFKAFMIKVGPAAADVLQKIVVTVATEAAKKSIGL